MTEGLPSWLAWVFSRIDTILLNPIALKNYAFTAIILAAAIGLEIAASRKWRLRYGSRNFRMDVLYYIFYYGGIYHLLVFSWIYKTLTAFVTAHAPWMQLNLLATMSPPMQILTMIVSADFLGYWFHRITHANRFLWAFHSIHHSQAVLTPMTNYRFHFVDETARRLWGFIPLQIFGFGIDMWLWADFIMA